MRLRTLGTDDGAVAILVAVFATVMFGLAAIVVDLGQARMLRADSRSGADAAALAGAGAVADAGGTSDATLATTVKSSVLKNTGLSDWVSSCPVTSLPAGWREATGGGTRCIAVHDGASGPDRVRVTLPTRRSVAGFGAIFGFGGIEVTATTQAQVRRQDVPGCGLCVFGSVDAKGPVTVTGGDSLAASSGKIKDSGFLRVDSPAVISFASQPDPPTGPYSVDPVTSPLPTDPFAGQVPPLPYPAAVADNKVTCDGGALPEGVYDKIEVKGLCTAGGGVFVTDELDVKKDGRLVTGFTSGSTIYLICGDRAAPRACASSGESGAKLKVAKEGSVDISASAASQFVLYVSPNNTSTVEVDGPVRLTGHVYAKRAEVDLKKATLSVAGRVVVGALKLDKESTAVVATSGAPTTAGPLDVRLSRVTD